MSDSGLNLNLECFKEHIKAPEFIEGVERGYWHIHEHPDVSWPKVLIWVSAPVRPNGPDRFNLKFSMDSYPGSGPTATLWDPTQNTKLSPSKWPKGTGNVSAVFNQGDFLYAPWDRLALAMGGHQNWPAIYRGMVWKPTYTIVHYLQQTRNLIESPEYHGC
jgi:hypothetical protein